MRSSFFILIFCLVLSANFLKVGNLFRSSAFVIEVERGNEYFNFYNSFPFSDVEGWLVFSKRANIAPFPSDLDIFKMMCSYAGLLACQDDFLFISDLPSIPGEEKIDVDVKAIIFVRQNEFIHVAAKWVLTAMLGLFLAIIILRDEK